MKGRFAVAVASGMFLFSGPAQDLKEMNFDQLRTNCTAEIEAGHYTALRNIKVMDLKVLVWYRIGTSPPYSAHALCWAMVTTDRGVRWAVADMVGAPATNRPASDLGWHTHYVFDQGNTFLLYFDHPPKNSDIYGSMIHFEFNVRGGRVLHDSEIIEENWRAATGEQPRRKFSNNSVQRTEASRSRQESDGTSASAGYRR